MSSRTLGLLPGLWAKIGAIKMKAKEALHNLHSIMKKELNFPLNLTEEYKIINQAIDEFEILKERDMAKTLIITPIDDGGIIATCPVCKEKYIFNEYNLGCEINFCSTCGQAVKWER